MRYIDRNVTPEDTPLDWLAGALGDAVELNVCVGFFDRAGGQLVDTQLRELLDRGGRIHLVVNRNVDGLPRYLDVVWALELFASKGDRATFRLVAETELNSKVYLVRNADGHRRALIGSANFTNAGLTRNWETCVALEDPDDRTLLDQVEATVRAWQDHPATVPVDLGAARALRLQGASSTGDRELLAEMLQPWLDRLEAAADSGDGAHTIDRVPTGFADLDRLLNGLRPAQLVVVGGAASIGKTTLALNFVRAAAIKDNIPAGMLTFALSKHDVMSRVLSAEARVPLHVLESGKLSNDDWTKLARRLGEISECPLLVNDSCAPSLRAVVTEIRRMAAEEGARLVLVDPAQSLYADRQVLNRQQEATEVSRVLKLLAVELGITIVVTCPTGRGPDRRTDRRPFLSDLDFAGAEHDADVVVLVHRDDFYDRESPRAGEADLMVVKQRQGPTDTVTVAAQLHLCRFVDMAI